MEIYTSYFGNVRKLKKARIVPISIALWKPRYFNGAAMYNVAPTKYMLSDKCSEEEYTKLYKDILSKLSPSEVATQISMLSCGTDAALCCYEKPDDFCHRHLLADWLNENIGLNISEFGISNKKEPVYKQASLF